MLLLDKGEVSPLYLAPTGSELWMRMHSMYRGEGHLDMLEIARVGISIRAPMFIWLNLASNKIDIFLSKNDHRLDFFCPSEADIKAKDIETSRDIKRSLQMSMEAAALNVKAYQMDGCDTHLAQIGLPMATYVSGLACGSLGDWLKFLSQTSLPMPIEAYRKQVESLVEPEYANVLAAVRKSENDKRKNTIKIDS